MTTLSGTTLPERDRPFKHFYYTNIHIFKCISITALNCTVWPCSSYSTIFKSPTVLTCHFETKANLDGISSFHHSRKQEFPLFLAFSLSFSPIITIWAPKGGVTLGTCTHRRQLVTIKIFFYINNDIASTLSLAAHFEFLVLDVCLTVIQAFQVSSFSILSV